MRFILPTMAAGLALSIGVAPAVAREHHHRHHHHKAPQRAKSHVTLHVSGHAVLGGAAVTLRGKVRPGGEHRVKVVFRGSDHGVLRARTEANGTFAVRWAPEQTGPYTIQAYGVHDRTSRGAHSKARDLTSYRLAGASYYGPGLYGNGVACGGTLEPGTLGVANKTLPCGTKVKLRYHGRSITVPVIDRGPYVAGRDYDLTEATKDRLGFPGVGDVLANH
jgi:rare lipoprotein A